MKKLFFILAAVWMAAVTMVSCREQNSPQQNTPQQDTSEYYVKYSISSSFYKFGSISYADVHSTGTDRMGDYSRTSTQWTVTVGPVKKNFYAFVKYERGTADIVKIEVSKNGSPFAIKASGEKEADFVINY